MGIHSNSVEASIAAELSDSIQAKQRVIEEELPTLSRIADLLNRVLREGRKILLFGTVAAPPIHNTSRLNWSVGSGASEQRCRQLR